MDRDEILKAADTLIASGAYDKAVMLCREALELEPTLLEVNLKLGRALLQLGLPFEARECFKLLADHYEEAGDLDALFDILNLMEEPSLERVRELEAQYQLEREQAPTLRKLLKMAASNEADGLLLEAIAFYEQALQLRRKQPRVCQKLALLYQRLGRMSEARVYFIGAGLPVPPVPSEFPGAPPVPSEFPQLLEDADLHSRYSLYDKALERLRRILSADPKNLDAHERVYRVYVAVGNLREAHEQLLTLLRLYTRHGAVERAQPFLNWFLEKDPSHPELPGFLAVLRPSGKSA